MYIYCVYIDYRCCIAFVILIYCLGVALVKLHSDILIGDIEDDIAMLLVQDITGVVNEPLAKQPLWYFGKFVKSPWFYCMYVPVLNFILFLIIGRYALSGILYPY